MHVLNILLFVIMYSIFLIYYYIILGNKQTRFNPNPHNQCRIECMAGRTLIRRNQWIPKL